MRPRTIRRLLAATVMAGVIAAVAPPAEAAVPQTITNQGRLFEAEGGPIEGTLTVLFAIYDSADADQPIWSEEHEVTFEEGYYSVSLGSIVPFGEGVFDGLAALIRDHGRRRAALATVAGQSVPTCVTVAQDVNGDIHPTSVRSTGPRSSTRMASGWGRRRG